MAKGDAKKVQIRNAGPEGDPHYVINFRGRDVTQFCREWELITGFVIPACHVVDAVINVAAQSEWRRLPSRSMQQESMPVPGPPPQMLNIHHDTRVQFRVEPAYREDPNHARLQDYEGQLRQQLERDARSRFRDPEQIRQWVDRELHYRMREAFGQSRNRSRPW